MHSKTLAEQARALQAREISSAELTRAYLDRIERLAPRLNCCLTVPADAATAAAEAADQRIAAG